MTAPTQHDAIVIGGSIGGLLAAAALSQRGMTVLVLERDTPPEGPAVRKGAPQGGQVHALLDSGRLAIEALLPGVFDDIADDGGLSCDFGIGLRWYHAGHHKVRCDSPYIARVQTRPLLEHHIRRRVAAMPGVTLRTGTRCTGLRIADGRIEGVVVSNEIFRASHVICATGRGTRPLRWLEDAGFGRPRERKLNIGIGYASRFYRLPADWPEERAVLMTYGTRPSTTRHGLAFRVEGDRLMVTLMGYHGDHPPGDPDGFAAFAASLEHPELGNILAYAEPLSEIRRFTTPHQVRYDLHRMALPEGLLIIGDAACGLDPVFGQGMSTAAVQAATIAEAPRLSTAPLMRTFAKIADRPWLITSLEAWRYPQTSGRLPGVGLVHAWLDRIYAVSAHDPEVHRAFLRVVNLHAPATALFAPSLVWRVMRGYRAGAPKPAVATT